jgi:hypothetical protein
MDTVNRRVGPQQRRLGRGERDDGVRLHGRTRHREVTVAVGGEHGRMDEAIAALRPLADDGAQSRTVGCRKSARWVRTIRPAGCPDLLCGPLVQALIIC